MTEPRFGDFGTSNIPNPLISFAGPTIADETVSLALEREIRVSRTACLLGAL